MMKLLTVTQDKMDNQPKVTVPYGGESDGLVLVGGKYEIVTDEDVQRPPVTFKPSPTKRRQTEPEPPFWSFCVPVSFFRLP